MAQRQYNIKQAARVAHRALCTAIKPLLTVARIIWVIAATPWLWLSSAVIAILNSILFCLTIPLHRRLEPLETQARQACSYEEWKGLQARIDEQRQVRVWSQQDYDPTYDWRGLQELKQDLELCRKQDDISALHGKLRAQATRNSCSILSPSLFLRSRIQTKRLIHDYVHELRRCVERLMRRESTTWPNHAHVEEENRRVCSDVRQILGRTTLVLQGGAMLSMCHLGVVRALHRRRLLPRIITATGTGALVAAIISCTPDNELLTALEGPSININSFIRSRDRRVKADARSGPLGSWIRAVARRLQRFIASGHFFDIDVLAQCVRDNIGDVTFEEAFAKSGRVLNITIAKPEVEGTPQLLNYITAPHVIVWSAVAASVATSKSMFAAAPLKCKNVVGVIDRYYSVDSAASSSTRRRRRNPRIPLERIGELFDVNHYIVSQTRPYIVPFIRLRDFMCRDPLLGAVTKFIYGDFLHRLDDLNRLGLVPTSIQRVLIDELVPSTATWSKFVITPELDFLDYFRIFNFPAPNVIDTWALKGERSVWPHICQIKIRCCVELELDAAYRRGNVSIRNQNLQQQPVISNGHSG